MSEPEHIGSILRRALAKEREHQRRLAEADQTPPVERIRRAVASYLTANPPRGPQPPPEVDDIPF